MVQRARRAKVAITREEREELRAGMIAETPELTFISRGDPDPRLVRLARLMGRQMARQDFAGHMKVRGAKSSR